MLKEKENLVQKIIAAADLLLILAAILAAYFFADYSRDHLPFSDHLPLYPLDRYLPLIGMLLVLWAVSLYSAGIYKRFRGRDLFSVCVDLGKAMLMVLGLFSALAYFFKIQYVSRIFMLTAMGLSLALLVIEKFFIYRFLLTPKHSGFYYRRILMVGTGLRAQNFMDLVHQHANWGLQIIGVVDDDASRVGKKVQGYSVMGTLADMPRLLKEHVVDEVVFVVPRSWMMKIEESILYCEELGKRVSVSMDYFNLKFAKARHTDLAGFPLLMFETTSDKIGQLLLKRFLDVVISSLALLIFSPLLISVAVLVKVTSKGPVFFKQERCSLHGRLFPMFKFRTMVMNAEARLEEIRKFNEMGGPAFKMTNDPRVTPIGKWLRKFSVDELPQLFNVIRGDMSIVGPRPPLPSEVELYETWQRRRLSMKSGLTCLWQAGGRNKISDFNEWMKLDLSYIDNWSLWLDLKIMVKTIPVVLMAHGTK